MLALSLERERGEHGCKDVPTACEQRTEHPLLQVAAALAHLHAVFPDAAHGRISARCVFVTSANAVALGRGASPLALAPSDATPSPKRHHGAGVAPASPSSPLFQALGSMAGETPFGTRRVSSGGAASPVTIRRVSSGGAASPVSIRRVSSSGATAPITIHRVNSGGAASPVTAMRRVSSSGASAPLAVSRADVPLLGRVTRVTMPPRSHSARSSLHDMAEASVWSRSGARPLCAGFPAPAH